MAYDKVFVALADPTRRRVFESLKQQPLSVGELAAAQPVSRPAVSQHLRVLAAANLVEVSAKGTRRVYSIKREGLEELRQYVESFWATTLASYAAEIERRSQAEVEP